MGRLKRGLRRLASAAARRVPRAGYRVAHAAVAQIVARRLERLAKSGKPIILGPYTSEVGHELLYWIPFLTNLVDRGLLDPERAISVSRGGNAAWYGGVARQHFNFFEQISRGEYVDALVNGRRGRLQKQLTIDTLDRRAIEHAVAAHGLTSFELLHPQLMNLLLLPVWKGGLPAEYELRHLRFQRFKLDHLVAAGAERYLPSGEYVAVKFHFNDNFPSTVENADFVRRLLNHLSARYTVLLLQLAEPPDDHAAPLMDGLRGNVIDCRDIPHADNLGIQTYLVSRAKYVVTSVGGFAMLPPFVGRAGYAFYCGGYRAGHFEVAASMFRALGAGDYHVADSRNFDLSSLP